jgi:hypothetical protein
VKKLKIIGCTLLLAAATLTGCTAMLTSDIKSDADKLNEKLGVPPTKSRTLANLGTPEARVALPDQAECLQYKLQLGGMTTTALGFDKNGALLAMDFDTCANAVSRGVFARAASKAAK